MFSYSSEYPVLHKLLCKVDITIKKTQWNLWPTLNVHEIMWSLSVISTGFWSGPYRVSLFCETGDTEQFRKDEAWHSPPANHLYLIITTLIRIIIKRD